MPETKFTPESNFLNSNEESLAFSLPLVDKNISLVRKKKNGKYIYHDEQADEETTKKKLSNLNFQHDDLDQVQHDCNCKRHTFKANILKPDMTKYSSYRQSFVQAKPIPNIVNKSKQYDKLQGPHIGLLTNYAKSFSVNQGEKIERRKPEDLLKTGGPSPFLTSYSSGFPGHRTVNQYVKPNHNQVRGDFPLQTKSTYAKEFGSHSCPKQITKKTPDTLKFNPVWMGETSYKSKFISPNPQAYVQRVKNEEKVEQKPLYKRQYETTYKNNFLGKEIVLCPAKQKLERKMKGTFSNTKDRFAENSDFKSLSPDYHAISTSKHYYV